MNVLSTFDGIGVARLALERAGIPITKYYASEVDKHAIQVCKTNWPDVKQLGDIRSLRGESIGTIDLYVGGSPCQGFSLSGKGLNFKDRRSRLFFEYFRLLTELKKVNPRIKFLLENVPMKPAIRDMISAMLEVEPIIISSNLVSAQNRKRLYWTNIPLVGTLKDRGLTLIDIIEPEPVALKYYLTENEVLIRTNQCSAMYLPNGTYRGRCDVVRPLFKRSVCLTTKLIRTARSATVIEDILGMRTLTPIEWERLQTLPDNYTAGIPEWARVHAIGNAWTTDVIKYLFAGLKL